MSPRDPLLSVRLARTRGVPHRSRLGYRVPMERHHGLDWLRIGAFGVLIAYHVGMVFVPWDFHVKLQTEDWVAVPMLATNPWRLALLFVVSGYDSRALFARRRAAGAFAANRSWRLLIPLLFGIIVVIPAQPWVELVTKHGYPHNFIHFWANDYFRFGPLNGLDLPTWQHLWFVVYLWVYTMLVATLLAALPLRARESLQRGFDAAMRGPGPFLIPAAWMLAVTTWWFVGMRETHGLFDDGVAHATYLPAFLFGFALAGSHGVVAAFARWWKPAALVALATYGVVVAIEVVWPGKTIAPPPYGRIFSAARAVQGWATIAALIGIAETYWNRDHRWRPMLTEAVFPFYIVHQTVIVVVAYWLIGAGLSLAANFAILVAATVAGCWTFYLTGRSIAPLRPLIGLRPTPDRRT